jgi:hypothetical protein
MKNPIKFLYNKYLDSQAKKISSDIDDIYNLFIKTYDYKDNFSAIQNSIAAFNTSQKTDHDVAILFRSLFYQIEHSYYGLFKIESARLLITFKYRLLIDIIKSRTLTKTLGLISDLEEDDKLNFLESEK